MKTIFLGTGSIIASQKQDNIPYRSYSSIFMELNNGETFLFDIGPGTLTKAQQYGIDTRIKPDNLCISHFI
jgi:ribonuclease BN (tRNA processing enzyme)